jgi:hypothetical protein
LPDNIGERRESCIAPAWFGTGCARNMSQLAEAAGCDLSEIGTEEVKSNGFPPSSFRLAGNARSMSFLPRGVL